MIPNSLKSVSKSAKNSAVFNQLVEDSLVKLRQSNVSDNVEEKAKRFAKDRELIARDKGVTYQPILFLCGHNANRSQMSEYFFNSMIGKMNSNNNKKKRFIGFSAGSTPTNEVNKIAIQVMKEKGIDMSGAFPKCWTAEIGNFTREIITMGCGDECAFFVPVCGMTGKKVLTSGKIIIYIYKVPYRKERVCERGNSSIRTVSRLKKFARFEIKLSKTSRRWWRSYKARSCESSSHVAMC